MTNKVAIITAGSKGMGAACVIELAQQGYQLAVMSRSNSVPQLPEGTDCISVAGDVTNPTDLEALVTTTMERYGRIDALVNNTGHPAKGDLLTLTDEDWHQGLDMVMLNVVRLARLVTPIMEQQGGGAIVNISTFGAKEPGLTYPVSSTLRAGLSAFTKLFADRYAKQNIRMNNVLPGFIDSYPVADDIRTTIPMDRAGTVQEVAQTAAFLLSSASSYITGQNICVDGGLNRSF